MSFVTLSVRGVEKAEYDRLDDFASQNWRGVHRDRCPPRPIGCSSLFVTSCTAALLSRSRETEAGNPSIKIHLQIALPKLSLALDATLQLFPA